MASYGRYLHSSGNRGGRSGGSGSTQSEFPINSETQPPLSPVRTSASTPAFMSLEQLLTQPGREFLQVLHPDCRNGATWFQFSNNGIRKCINRMLNDMLSHPYETFSKMPERDKDIWFRQFAQEFNWDPELTPLVRHCFWSRAAGSYTNKMSEWKKRWKKNQMPREMKDNPDLWRALIQYWMTPEAQSISARNSTNRKSDRKGKGLATHNLGATTKESRKLQLEKIDGQPPSLLRLMVDAHTNRKTGVIDDPVAREISEAVTMRCEDFIQSQGSVDGPPCTEVPVDKINEYVIELTPKSRGRFYGIPQEGLALSGCSFSNYCDSGLRAELNARNQAIEALQAEVALLKEKQDEQMKQQEEHMRQQEERIRLQREEDRRLLEEERAAYREMQQQLSQFFRNNPTPSE